MSKIRNGFIVKVQVVGKGQQPLSSALLLMRKKLEGFNGDVSWAKTNKILPLFPGSTVIQQHSLGKEAQL